MEKILYLASHLSTGGMPQFLEKRLELLKDDYDLYVVEYSDISSTYIVQKNRVRKIIKPQNFYTLGEKKEELLDIINVIKPDIIHFEEMPEVFNMNMDIANKIFDDDRDYKIFETTHSSDFDVENTVYYPDKFIFVSQFNSFRFAKLGVPIDVVEYPTDLISRDDHDLFRKELGLDPDYIHVINVGLFTPRKNQAYAFDIARKFIGEKVKFHFIGNHADNFKYYWTPLLNNVPTNCVIWGERSDVQKFYTACDVFLFTSRGFKYDKELNPLVIKEALSSGLPNVLFPLDVYCSKYDNNPWVTYLNGDLDGDVEILRDTITKVNDGYYDKLDRYINIPDYRFESDNIKKIESNEVEVVDNKDVVTSLFNGKYKVKAIHLLLKDDERSEESIGHISNIGDFDIEYIKHVNEIYTDTPPRDSCARPGDVGRLGPYGLNGPHYGGYTSFRNAIEKEFTPDIDFLMLFEGDCILKTDIYNFINKIKDVLDVMDYQNLSYMSIGDKRNLMTGEVVSDVVEKIPYVDWMYVTNKIIGIQSIIFSKNCRDFLLDSYKTRGWDTTDLYFNGIFPSYLKKAILNDALTTQSEGKSILDGVDKIHFDNRQKGEFTEDDIILQYNTHDKKIWCSLVDVYRNDVEVDVRIRDVSNILIHDDSIKFSVHNAINFSLFNIENYDRLYLDFVKDNISLFTKEVIINKDKVELYKDGDLGNFIIDDNIKNYFDISYNYDDSRVYVKYLKPSDIKYKIIIKDVDSGNELYQTTLTSNIKYHNWMGVYKNHVDVRGYSLDFYDNNNKLMFDHDIIFDKNKIKLNVVKNDIVYNYIQNSSSSDVSAHLNNINRDEELIIISAYPNTSIKSEVTKKCIDSLKKLNRKILLSSHYPVSTDIQNMVDYYLYDGYNPVIDHSFYRYAWYSTGDYKVDINFGHLNNVGKNQSLTVLNNIYNSISFANRMGFKRVINMTYDYILSDLDLNGIENISNRLNVSGKQGYLMRFKDSNLDTLKSVFFVMDTSSYLNVIGSFRTPDEFNKECGRLGCENFLENFYYHKFKNNLNDYIVEETTEEKIFSTSNINIFSECEYLTLLSVADNDDVFAIWYNSSNVDDDRVIRINIYNNDILISKLEHVVTSKSLFYKLVRMRNNDKFKVVFEFYDNKNKYRDDIILYVDDKLSQNGVFTMFNKLDVFDRPKISTIINYNSNYYSNLPNLIKRCKIFSDEIVVPVCDRFVDGTEENRGVLDKTYDENDDDVKFIEYEFDDKLLAGGGKGMELLFDNGNIIGLSQVSDDIDNVLLLGGPYNWVNDESIMNFYNLDDMVGEHVLVKKSDVYKKIIMNKL